LTRLTGYSLHELEQTTVNSLFYSKIDFFSFWADTAAKGQCLGRTAVLYRKDGTTFPAMIDAQKLTIDETLLLVLTVVDLSRIERKVEDPVAALNQITQERQTLEKKTRGTNAANQTKATGVGSAFPETGGHERCSKSLDPAEENGSKRI
jgi:hypothetical protein